MPLGLNKWKNGFRTINGLAEVSWNKNLRSTAGRCRMAVSRDRFGEKKIMVELAPHILGWNF